MRRGACSRARPKEPNMTRHCLNCDAPLSNVWPWSIGNEDGLCFNCDDALWAQDGEIEEAQS